MYVMNKSVGECDMLNERCCYGLIVYLWQLFVRIKHFILNTVGSFGCIRIFHQTFSSIYEIYITNTRVFNLNWLHHIKLEILIFWSSHVCLSKQLFLYLSTFIWFDKILKYCKNEPTNINSHQSLTSGYIGILWKFKAPTIYGKYYLLPILAISHSLKIIIVFS